MTQPLTDNAMRVLEARYLQRDSRGQIIESPAGMFHRVARCVAAAEKQFTSAALAQHFEERFCRIMSDLEFLPNSPTLMNAGPAAGQLSACFVLPVEDRLAEIFESLKVMAVIQQSGGGTGFSFSRLRPKGDWVSPAGGIASGPVSFMRVFDCATQSILQGGRRRGANMGVLNVDHPDILDFVDAKLDLTAFRNFNLSVGITDEFMRTAQARSVWPLRNPRTGQVTGQLPAHEMLDRMVEAAWTGGDPGLLFLDTINRDNPTPQLGRIEATNPCGEVPLLPWEACNLGSINLARMLRQTAHGWAVDWSKLADTTRLGMRFLDNVIECSVWPDPRIANMVRSNRKTGLGVMGFADMLVQLGIPYDDPAAEETAQQVMQFIAEHADAESEQLANERGVFPNWPSSLCAAQGRRLRNATRTSIAPTGTIGLIAGTSSGIEPLFGLVYRREHVLGQQTLNEMHPLFLEHLRKHGCNTPEIVGRLAECGNLAQVPDVPNDVRRLFRTALEVRPEAHLKIQAAFQKWVNNAVSKTINLPHECPRDAIRDVFLQAWQLGLKGVTVYRYGCRQQQVLSLGLHVGPNTADVLPPRGS